MGKIDGWGTYRHQFWLCQGPNSCRAGTGCEYTPTTRSLLSNTDVDSSPMGDPGSPRDRVRETAEAIIMSNVIDFLGQQGTHCPGARTFLHFFTYLWKLMSDSSM